jgi:hypothetical protein
MDRTQPSAAAGIVNNKRQTTEARKERQEQHLGVLSVHLGDLGGNLSSRGGKDLKISRTDEHGCTQRLTTI